MRTNKFLLTFALLLASFVLSAQMVEPIKWSFSSEQNRNEAELSFKATIENDWHLYDVRLPEGGPIATSIHYADSSLFEFIGEITTIPKAEEHFDETFQMTLRYFSNEVEIKQKLKLKSDGPVEIKGHVEFMGCNDETCLPPNEADFSFSFNTEKQEKTAARQTSGPSPDNAPVKSQGMWIFLLVSLLAGLAAVVTPCVFPMIPMTVSFFIRGSENRGKAISTGLFFGLSIVFIYTLLGALFSFGVFGPNAGNILSTHWIPNLVFFLLFLIFAISFLGAFEIVLPSSLVNKTDAKADKGGFVGAFFMALTTVIVSFSCTGPFVGALIIEAVQVGGLRPMLGMFAFGLAFATPFTLLAVFPSAMKKLPKSGGWLNAVKVVFAFILMAFGMKFLSNIDQVYGLGLISREIYITIWTVLFFLLGMYFLGKIKFSHDSDLPFISVPRLILAIVTFSFTIYLFTGLFGASLNGISSLIPPPSPHTFSMQQNVVKGNTDSAELCGPARYAGTLHLPQSLPGYFDFEQGMDCAREQGKPAFVVFKGHACANCKKMESSVWTDPETLKLLNENYVVIGLYTDDRTSLPEEEWYTSELDGKEKNTLGKKNLDILISRYQTNSIPFHAIIQPDGTQKTLGVTFDANEFREFVRNRPN
ncbi:MAG: protein-disulfide reductase DsbD family protein [Prolixibacteraceae bacterium]|jgi:thiol:disulfide interchange protein DsbD|nr:protein-disulfide reductase DsbD family protein [Prolixibacteraceae bacterium]